ncbi:MAG: hypothetical protein K0T00_145 [Gaiellaceae bacterium]|nr:hypothetical protein [Gaiellaceae bacterium]
MIRLVDKRLLEESLTGSWLSSRLGVGTHRLDAMRRGGELLGVRRPGGQDYLYPSWQFDADGKPRAVLPRLIAAARGRGVSDDRLYEILTSRAGLSGTTRLADELRDGREDYVLAVVRSG